MANKSRALKRLGAAGVGACTLIATPYLGFTSPAMADTTNAAFFAPFTVTTVSSRPDGTDSTVRLVADAPATTATVDFTYQIGAATPVLIATDGARPYLTDWNTVSLAGPVTLRAVAKTAGGVVLSTATSAVTIDNNAATVNITSTAATTSANGSVGRFKANDTVAVSGTTSTGYAGTVDVADISGTVAGPADLAARVPATVLADGTWSAIVPVTGASLGTPALPTPQTAALNARTTGASATDETEPASIYDQAITTVTATPSPLLTTPGTTAVETDEKVPVTVTVLDQNGKPVGGAIVASDVNQNNAVDAGIDDATTTNALGVATLQVPRTVAGTRNVDIIANQTNASLAAGIYDSSAGDKKITVVQTSAAPVATTATFTAVDTAPAPVPPGVTNVPAFPATETSFSTAEALPTARLSIKDQNGANVPDGTPVLYSVTFNPDENGPDVPANTVRTPLAPLNSTANTVGGNIDIPVAGAEGTYTINAFVNRDGDLAQSAGDLVATTTFTFDQAKLTFDSGNTGQAEAGAAAGTTRSLTYALDNGTPLDGRAINVAVSSAATPASSRAILSTTQPATASRISDISATVVTDAAGKGAVALTDPVTLVDEDGSAVTPNVQQQEDVTLTATALRPRAGAVAGQNTATTVVRFIRGASPAELRVDAVNGVFGGTTATPGRPVDVTLSVDNFFDGSNADTGTNLSGLPVTLTTDKGYFTQATDATPSDSSVDNTGELQPATAPTAPGAPVGAYTPVAGAYTLISSDNGSTPPSLGGLATGQVRFTLAIDRDAGFDDDGLVTATVKATVGGVTRDIKVVFSTDENATTVVPATPGAAAVSYDGAAALNPSATDPLVITPIPAAESLVNRSANADNPGFQIRRKDAFGNLVSESNALSVNIGNLSTGSVDSSYTADIDPTFTVSSGLSGFQVTGPELTRSQTITATDTAATRTYADSDGVASGFQFSRTAPIAQTTGTLAISDTQDITYYSPVVTAFTYSFASTPGNTVPVNTAVNTVVTVKDSHLNPVQGLNANFFRSGPFLGSADQTGTGGGFTDNTGRRGFTFTSPAPGRAVVTVVVTNSGIELGRGVQNVDFTAGVVPSGTPVITLPRVIFPRVGVPYLFSGTGTPGRVVGIVGDKAGPEGPKFIKYLLIPANGKWSFVAVGSNDYRFYAQVGSSKSNAITQLVQPTVAGPRVRTVARGSRVNLTGRGAPGTSFVMGLHKAGTAGGFTIKRNILVRSNGTWALGFNPGASYTFVVKRAGGPLSATYTIVAR